MQHPETTRKMSINSSLDRHNELNKIGPDDEDHQNYPLPVLIGDSATRRRQTTKMALKRKQRIGIFNPATISTVLILYFISNQSITMIMSAGRNLTADREHQYKSGESAKLIGRSLVNLVAANPSPEPAAAVARSASSGSHRSPPMNGSIFGKRSLGGGNSQTNRRPVEDDSSADNDKPKVNNNREESDLNQSQISELSGSLSKQQQQQAAQRQQPTTSYPYTSSSAINEATNYKDIITETIENFLSLNNESDPEEASVAFCRMILYECKQMLSARSRARRERKRKAGQRAGLV